MEVAAHEKSAHAAEASQLSQQGLAVVPSTWTGTPPHGPPQLDGT
jgi:hypothetical protein